MDGEFEKQLRSGLILVPQTNILRHTGLLSLVKPPTAWSAAPSLKGLVNGNNRFRLSEVVLITHNFNTLLLAPRLTVQVATGPFAPILRRTRRAGPVLPPGHPGPRLGASDTAEAGGNDGKLFFINQLITKISSRPRQTKTEPNCGAFRVVWHTCAAVCTG